MRAGRCEDWAACAAVTHLDAQRLLVIPRERIDLVRLVIDDEEPRRRRWVHRRTSAVTGTLQGNYRAWHESAAMLACIFPEPGASAQAAVIQRPYSEVQIRKSPD